MIRDTEDVVAVKTMLFHLRCDIAPNDDSPFTGKNRATLIKERRDAADLIQSLSDRFDVLTQALADLVNAIEAPRCRAIELVARAALQQEGK